MQPYQKHYAWSPASLGKDPKSNSPPRNEKKLHRTCKLRCCYPKSIYKISLWKNKTLPQRQDPVKNESHTKHGQIGKDLPSQSQLHCVNQWDGSFTKQTPHSTAKGTSLLVVHDTKTCHGNHIGNANFLYFSLTTVICKQRTN